MNASSLLIQLRNRKQTILRIQELLERANSANNLTEHLHYLLEAQKIGDSFPGLSEQVNNVRQVDEIIKRINNIGSQPLMEAFPNLNTIRADVQNASKITPGHFAQDAFAACVQALSLRATRELGDHLCNRSISKAKELFDVSKDFLKQRNSFEELIQVCKSIESSVQAGDLQAILDGIEKARTLNNDRTFYQELEEQTKLLSEASETLDGGPENWVLRADLILGHFDSASRVQLPRREQEILAQLEAQLKRWRTWEKLNQSLDGIENRVRAVEDKSEHTQTELRSILTQPIQIDLNKLESMLAILIQREINNLKSSLISADPKEKDKLDDIHQKVKRLVFFSENESSTSTTLSSLDGKLGEILQKINQLNTSQNQIQSSLDSKIASLDGKLNEILKKLNPSEKITTKKEPLISPEAEPYSGKVVAKKDTVRKNNFDRFLDYFWEYRAWYISGAVIVVILSMLAMLSQMLWQEGSFSFPSFLMPSPTASIMPTQPPTLTAIPPTSVLPSATPKAENEATASPEIPAATFTPSGQSSNIQYYVSSASPVAVYLDKERKLQALTLYPQNQGAGKIFVNPTGNVDFSNNFTEVLISAGIRRDFMVEKTLPESGGVIHIANSIKTTDKNGKSQLSYCSIYAPNSDQPLSQWGVFILKQNDQKDGFDGFPAREITSADGFPDNNYVWVTFTVWIDSEFLKPMIP